MTDLALAEGGTARGTLQNSFTHGAVADRTIYNDRTIGSGLSFRLSPHCTVNG